MYHNLLYAIGIYVFKLLLLFTAFILHLIYRRPSRSFSSLALYQNATRKTSVVMNIYTFRMLFLCHFVSAIFYFVTAIGNIPTPSSALIASLTPGDIFTPLYPFRYVGNYEQTFQISASVNKLITLQV